MRNLEECKAEIFRRSKERIEKRRKTRKRVLVSAASLVLFSSVCSAMVGPGIWCMGVDDAESLVMEDKDWAADMIQESEVNQNAIDQEFEHHESSSIVCSYVEVEIQAKSYYWKTVDKVEVTKIFSAIHSLYNGNDIIISFEQDGKDIEECENVITFATEDGSKTIYTLDGNRMVNTSTYESIFLLEEQLIDFKETVGLAE